MRIIIVGIVVGAFTSAGYIIGVYHGIEQKKNEIMHRAFDTDLKDCYHWQEIEVIIFGENTKIK